MASGFFRSFRNFFSKSSEEGIEEALDAFVDPADTSVTPSLESRTTIYSADPSIEGEDIPYFHREKDTKDVFHEEFQYRLEHEPYRFEPDGDMVVCVTKAYLYEIHPLKVLSVERHALSPLTIKVTDNCVVYTQFSTDEHGQFKGEYKLLKADAEPNQDIAFAPPCTHFELPDEDCCGGSDGQYNIPLFWIVDGKLHRNFWDNEEDPERETLLMGGLEGHRGPMWWIKGYNCLKNIGTGEKVYKDYTLADDFKNLRTLKEKGQEHDSSTFPIGDPPTQEAPFTGDAQVQVKKSDGGDEIEIFGNRFNKHWKIGENGVAIVEDGLVTCLKDLECVDVTTQSLTTASIYTGTASVAACPTTGNYQDEVWNGGTTTNVWVGGTTNSNVWVGGTTTNVWVGGTTNSTVWNGGTTTNVWVGGTTNSTVWNGGATNSNMWAGGANSSTIISGSTTDTIWSGGTVASNVAVGTTHSTMWADGAPKDLEYHEVCLGGSSSGSTIWALCVPKTGAYASSAPPTVTALCDATTVTGLTDASTVYAITAAGSGTINTVTGVAEATTVQCIVGASQVQGVVNVTTTTAVTGTDLTEQSGITGASYTTAVTGSDLTEQSGITGASYTTAVTGTDLTEVSGITGASHTTAVTGTDLTEVSGITGASHTTVVKDLDCISAVTPTYPVTVYVSDGSTLKFLEAPSTSSDGATLKLVKCPPEGNPHVCPPAAE